MSCAAVLAVADDTRITATQFRVFALIAKGYCKRSEIAEKVGVTVVTIARAIDALVKLRLIERELKRGKPSILRIAGNIISATRIMGDTATRITGDASGAGDTTTRIAEDTTTRIIQDGGIICDTGDAVDKSPTPCIGTGARAETLNLNTRASDQIRSDLIPVSKERIDSLIERAAGTCDATAPGLHHGAVLNRLLRGGCDWEDDILPAVDKLAASFRRRGKRFSTWELLIEHATEFRDRRLQGIPEPVQRPVTPIRSGGMSRGPYRANGIAPLTAVG